MALPTPGSPAGEAEHTHEMVDVCVYGAGIIGLFNALQYAKRGLRVAIVDGPAGADEAADKAGESLLGFSNAMLRSVGDLDAEISRSYEQRGMWFVHGYEDQKSFDGVTEWAEYSPLPEAWTKKIYGDEFGRAMFQNAHVVRPEIEAVLRERMAEQPLITVIDSGRVVDVALGSGAEPHLTTWRAGDRSADGRVRSRWVVDCTGPTRFLAGRLGRPAPPADDVVTSAARGQFAHCTDDDFAGWEYTFPEGATARRDHTTAHLWGDGYWISLIRLTQDRISVGVSLDRRILKDREQLRDAFWRIVRRYPALDFLTEETCLDFSADEDVRPTCEVRVSPERYVLAGDAASTVDAYYGQGLSQAMLASWHGANIAERDIKDGVLDTAYAERVNRTMKADRSLLRSTVEHKLSPAIADSRFFMLDHLLDFLIFAAIVPARYRMTAWLVGTGGRTAQETPETASHRSWLQEHGFLNRSFPFGLLGPEAAVSLFERTRSLNERNARWRLTNGITPAPMDGVLRSLAPLPATWRLPPALLRNRPVSLTPRVPTKDLRPPDFEAGLPMGFRVFTPLALPFVVAAIASDALLTGVQRARRRVGRRLRGTAPASAAARPEVAADSAGDEPEVTAG